MSDDDLHAAFIKNLKAARVQRGYTQDTLADSAGVSSNHVSMIESGRRFPSIGMIEKLADVLNIRAYELFIEDDVLQEEIDEALRSVYLRDVKRKLTEFIDSLQPGLE